MRTKFTTRFNLVKKSSFILILVLLWILLVYLQTGDRPLKIDFNGATEKSLTTINSNCFKCFNGFLSVESIATLGSEHVTWTNQLITDIIMTNAVNFSFLSKKNSPIGSVGEVGSVIIITATQADNIVASNNDFLHKESPTQKTTLKNTDLSLKAQQPIFNMVSSLSESGNSKSIKLAESIVGARTGEIINTVSVESNISTNNAKTFRQESIIGNVPLPGQYTHGLEPGLLGVSVNHNADYTDPQLVLYSESVLCIESSLFPEFKINPQTVKAFNFIDATLTSYACFVNGAGQANVNYDLLKGNVLLNLPGYMLQQNNIPLTSGPTPNSEVIVPLDAIYSNNTNYQLQAMQTMQNSINTNQLAGNFSNTTSTPLGSLIANLSYLDMNGWQRNSAYWETDYLQPMTSLLVGDIAPNPGVWGGGSSLGGVQYGTNTALRPYASFVATPTIRGVVDQPSQMDILLDGNTFAPTAAIPAGAYNVYNLPVINGDGTLTVNLKNNQGVVVQSLTMPYFSAPQVLQKGTYFYQYNLGLAPTSNMAGLDWGYQTNQPAFSTQHSYAFNNYYTLDLHSEAQSGSFYNFGLNHNLNLFNTLYSGFYTALSQAESGGGGVSAGFTLARLANKTETLGASYSYGVSTPQFATLGYTPGQMSSNQILQSVSLTYATDFSLSMGLGYTSNSGVTGGGVSVYSGNMTYQPFTGSSLMLQAAQTTFGSNSSLSLMLNFTYALQSGSINSSYQMNNSSNSNNSTYNLGYQYFDPTNTWGYNLNEQYMTDVQQPNTLGAGGYYAFKNFNTNANVAYADNTTYASNGSIAGNVIVARNGVNLARTSSGSFVIVKVGDLPNIGVLLGDTYMGSTDRNGEFTVPNIQPYVPQQIKIRTADLPLNTELDSYAKNLVAPLNGGVMLEFKVVHYTPAMVSLSYNNGQIPPVGYAATLFNAETKEKVEDLIIIDNGVVMISKFSAAVNYYLEFTVKSGNYSCQINKDNIDKQASNEYQYVLKDVRCTLKP